MRKLLTAATFFIFLSAFGRLLGMLILRRTRTIVICDIDDTIVRRNTDNADGYALNCKVYPEVVSFVGTTRLNSKAELLFLSARSIRHYYRSKQLIGRLFGKRYHLILTRKAEDKILYLNIFAIFARVYYFDDLSFAQGRKRLYFEDAIAGVRKNRNIFHFDHQFLRSLQSIAIDMNEGAVREY